MSNFLAKKKFFMRDEISSLAATEFTILCLVLSTSYVNNNGTVLDEFGIKYYLKIDVVTKWFHHFKIINTSRKDPNFKREFIWNFCYSGLPNPNVSTVFYATSHYFNQSQPAFKSAFKKTVGHLQSITGWARRDLKTKVIRRHKIIVKYYRQTDRLCNYTLLLSFLKSFPS